MYIIFILLIIHFSQSQLEDIALQLCKFKNGVYEYGEDNSFIYIYLSI